MELGFNICTVGGFCRLKNFLYSQALKFFYEPRESLKGQLMNSTDTAIILAGGRSLRMGFDKQLLRLNDEYLLEKNLLILLEIFKEVIVVSNEPSDLWGIQNISRAKVIQDIIPQAGPLGGIHAGLSESSSDYAFVLAVDMPVVDQAYILKLKNSMAHANSFDGLINISQASGEPEPFCAFYGKHLIPDIEAFIKTNRRSLRHFIDHHNFLRVNYPGTTESGSDIFFNINDKNELRQFHEKNNPEAGKLSNLEETTAAVIQSMPIIRYKGKAHADLTDDVITEAEISLYINGAFFQTMYCTPKHLRELITGNLYAQGRIQAPEELLELDIRSTDQDGLVLFDVYVTVKSSPELEEAAKVTTKIFTTSGASAPPLPFKGSLIKENIDLELDMERIMEISAIFQDTSALFARTGGNHACALIENGEMISFMEDIGRHNALDKLIGKALMENKDLSRCMILLSGRMASEMTRKVLRTPVSALLSRAAPTDRSVRLAEENNLTMIGFIRGQRLNVYHLNKGHRLKDYEK